MLCELFFLGWYAKTSLFLKYFKAHPRHFIISSEMPRLKLFKNYTHNTVIASNKNNI